MSARRHAIKVGLNRGWAELKLSLRSPQDQGFYIVVALIVLGYLYGNRATPLEGTDLYLPSVALPSLLGGLLAFGAVVGPTYTLALEREDGTLLRAKALPHGMTGYVTGQLLFQSMSVVPMFLVILVPSFLLFDGLAHRGALGWLTMLWVLLLGLLATLPIGMIIGSVVPSPQKVGTWGILPVMVLAAISGVFVPVQALWGWVQTIAQVFPMYWIGLGMRSAFLPDAAAVLELGGTWRTWQTVAVLAAWAIGSALVMPTLLRRMARRQSGAAVLAAREAAGQLVR